MRRGFATKRWGWMALVAIWLTVLAPTVSRTMQAGFAFPDLGAWCETASTSHHDDRAHHDDADEGACGYCTLFAQAPVLGGAIFFGHLLPLPGHVQADLPPMRAVAPVAIVHAPPRGPPVATHA